MAKHIDKAKLAMLRGELSELREKGVVDEASALKIAEYYAQADCAENTFGGQEAERSETAVREAQEFSRDIAEEIEAAPRARTRVYFTRALVSLGLLLIGGGSVLLYGQIWDALSRLEKLVGAFIPVIIGAACGIYTIVKEKDAVWREVSAVLTSFGFVSAAFAVPAIYQFEASVISFANILLPVSLPLIYIFRSYLLTVLYCLGLFIFMQDMWREVSLFDLGTIYTAAVAPWIIFNLFLRKPFGAGTVLMRYISLIPLMFICFSEEANLLCAQNLVSVIAMLYVAGLSIGEGCKGKKGWTNPWLSFGWLLFTVILVCASNSVFEPDLRNWFLHVLPENLINFWLIPLVVGLFVTLRKPTPLKAVIMLSVLGPASFAAMMRIPLLEPVLSHLLLMLPRGSISWAACAYLLLAAAALLAHGLKAGSLLTMNAGMLQIILLIGFKFFDSRVDALVRSMIFIVVGVAFIAVNVGFVRGFTEGKKELQFEGITDEK